MPDRLTAAVRAEAIRTLYVQARTSAAAALIVTIYMVVAAWNQSDHRVILGWLTVQALVQLARMGMVEQFQRRRPADAALPGWARGYTLYMFVAGLLWGLSSFLFMHADQPISIALTLCGLYGISGGSVPGNAYNPPGVYAFVVAIFGCVLVELLRQGQFVYAVLGFASAAFAAILIMFCRIQARSIEDSFRIRFENRALLAEVTLQREAAEAARAQAEQASLTKSQFLAAASHDLRQPLHALSLLAGSLRSLAKAGPTATLATEMLANIRALGGLFNGLLDLARLDAGVVRAERQPLVCDELFDRLNHFLGSTSAERGIDLRFRSDGAVLDTDPVLIEQVMLNLAANAVNNTHRGGVLCAARRRGDRIRLEVWDTGKGIEAHELDRIFGEFVQLDNVARDRRRGMGLGLAIARRSAAVLGTDIQVASRPGRGSVFWFTQPIATASPAPAEPFPILRADAFARPATNVLLVDDDEAVRRSLDILFADWGVPARIVPTAQAALDALATDRFTHMLTDYRLPGAMDGFDLLLALQADSTAPAIETFLITGDMDARLIARASQHGITLLHKPLSPAQLRSLLGLPAE